ncbi:hypothetical protein Tco_0314528, partial [Tanacetum coccineum]
PQPSDPIGSVVDEAVYKELGNSLATPNESSLLGTTLGGGPRVLDLEKTKTSQDNEIASLKKRLKKLEKKNRSRTHSLKRLYKVGLTARVISSSEEYKTQGEKDCYTRAG